MEVKVVELLAVREALNWIKKQGWERVVLESDAQSVVMALNSSGYIDLISYGSIILKCRAMLNEINFSSC